MSITIGSRRFAPRLGLTLLTLALLGFLISLGRWQLHRAEEKRELFAAFAAGGDAIRPVKFGTAELPRYQHLEAHGRYDSSRQILLDSMVGSNGRAGYHVLTPLALAGGGWLLVNRGWVPAGADRAHKPDIAVDGALRRVRGRADRLPVPGIRMGGELKLAPPYPVVANFPRAGELARLLGESQWATAAEVVLLDPGEADGYERNWTAPGFPPMRHVAYAVQWFGLALALAVIYVVTNLERTRPAAEGAA